MRWHNLGDRSFYGWRFGPGAGVGIAFGSRGRFFETGEVRLAMLSLLSEGAKHGYQLMKELEERSGGTYKASAGTIYPTLQQMEDDEYGRCDQDQEAGHEQAGQRTAGLFKPALPGVFPQVGSD